MIENEIPKHRKKKQSSTSKSSTKSKHKHEYKEVLLIHNNRPHWRQFVRSVARLAIYISLKQREQSKDIIEVLILMKCMRNIRIWRI